jgi:hypothetical protein
MTPQTLLIDRNFKGVGRIKRATGTTNPVVRRKYSRMLDTLKDEGQIGILRSIRDGLVTFAEVYDAFQRRALNELTEPDTLKPLGDRYAAWLEKVEASEKHKISLAYSGRIMLDAMPSARVSDLPAILEKLAETVGRKTPRTFNLIRSAASAFVRQTLRKSHPLYMEVTAVGVAKVIGKRRGRPLSVVQLRNWFPNPTADPVDAIAWGMATTGMGPKEFYGKWKIVGSHIHIEGTKREYRNRVVPLVMPITRPAIHDRTFADAVRERTNRQIQPYDLRRTYANALENSGIIRTRRRLYMGHAPQDDLDLYEYHDVRPHTETDGAKLREFFGLVPTEPHTIPNEKPPELRIAK